MWFIESVEVNINFVLSFLKKQIASLFVLINKLKGLDVMTFFGDSKVVSNFFLRLLKIFK